MASSSGNSSGSSQLQNSGSEEDMQVLMDQRKRKRMLSNRESARRSRMRKQQHLDDLMSQVSQLRKDNSQILTSINITTQHFLNVEAENSILRAQMMELSQRLDSLNEILNYINTTTSNGIYEIDHPHHHHQDATAVAADSFMNPLNLIYLNQPIMASPDLFQY
ncbi:Ocs element-binding factor, putative [Ricinus communis]|uniref:Ocs element-binding factor, putative n=1 Tax=Ricinus communis TaxID=3988 RepID=B9R7Z2_RICCO|nr:Ocs element-binding factor, putative [Ricinus communis]WRJ36071.1 bzip [Ricinus communis]|eukprot:XP_002510435.1 bZIP transcription factor 11 [Ricinus communis]